MVVGADGGGKRTGRTAEEQTAAVDRLPQAWVSIECGVARSDQVGGVTAAADPKAGGDLAAGEETLIATGPGGEPPLAAAVAVADLVSRQIAVAGDRGHDPRHFRAAACRCAAG
jgi:hypothetical protein